MKALILLKRRGFVTAFFIKIFIKITKITDLFNKKNSCNVVTSVIISYFRHCTKL